MTLLIQISNKRPLNKNSVKPRIQFNLDTIRATYNKAVNKIKDNKTELNNYKKTTLMKL